MASARIHTYNSNTRIAGKSSAARTHACHRTREESALHGMRRYAYARNARSAPVPPKPQTPPKFPHAHRYTLIVAARFSRAVFIESNTSTINNRPFRLRARSRKYSRAECDLYAYIAPRIQSQRLTEFGRRIRRLRQKPALFRRNNSALADATTSANYSLLDYPNRTCLLRWSPARHPCFRTTSERRISAFGPNLWTQSFFFSLARGSLIAQCQESSRGVHGDFLFPFGHIQLALPKTPFFQPFVQLRTRGHERSDGEASKSHA